MKLNTKVVILAGGFGTRILEKGEFTPKPMIPIGGRPIIGHIMDWYGSYGLSNFIAATGYLSEKIELYFESLSKEKPSWNLRAINTGLHSQTGERIRQIFEQIPDDEIFLTYGDGLSNVDIRKLYDLHKSEGKIVTVTAVRPPARFGRLDLDGNIVRNFSEKQSSLEGWINGGFFVVRRDVLAFLHNDNQPFESEPLTLLASVGELAAYRHQGFWHPMDTKREQQDLEEIWNSTAAPWKV